MARKVAIVSDSGIDGALALATAMFDRRLDVVGVVASAGNVSATQATRNVQTLVSYLDPPKWPRLGAALPVEYDLDGRQLHGPSGLGALEVQPVELHHSHPGDKLLADTIRSFGGELTLLNLGPLTLLATLFEREPELARLVRDIVVVGGSWREPGDVSAVAEFHMYCAPAAARRILHLGAPVTLLPLDVTRRLLVAPAELFQWTDKDCHRHRLLRRIASYGFCACAQYYGIEGIYLQDLLGVCYLSRFALFKAQPMSVDVETRGELTRGMTVFDLRPRVSRPHNVNVALEADIQGVRDYLRQVLSSMD